MNFTAVSGKSATESPLPDPELALGNLVVLKKPYRGDGREYRYGVIVEHVGWNAFGKPMVSLHLYSEDGRMYMIPETVIPTYVDFCATELTLLAIARQSRVFPEGFDLFPTCPECNDIGQHPFAENACQSCGGWGVVRNMMRVKEDESATGEGDPSLDRGDL